MNKVSKTGIIFFIFLIVGFIIYSIITIESFGDLYIEQVRVSDSENTLKSLDDKELIELGKSVCKSGNTWTNEEYSILAIKNVLMEYGINVNIDNRIIPIIRFQSIYELCPENIIILENIFQTNE